MAACSGTAREQAGTGSPSAGASSSALTRASLGHYTPATRAAEAPLPAESNPPGDIPDQQQFVPYSSGGFSLDVPEGWARKTAASTTTFTDKFDGESVTTSASAHQPAASTSTPAVSSLIAAARAPSDIRVQPAQLPAGSSVSVTYSSNSDPDAVTGKRVRLENQAYLFYRGGQLVTLRLWAPLGADNVDQWRHIAQSFRWH